MDVESAVQTHLANIEQRTGKSLAEMKAIIASSGLIKHGQIRDMLKRQLEMSFGDANAITSLYLREWEAQAAAAAAEAAGAPSPAGPTDPLDAIYVGGKAHMRPIHERIRAAVDAMGEYETAPKKGYVSLRRRRQFAMVGPATNTRLEVSLNMKGVPGGDRLEEQAPGGMCSHKVRLTSVAEVDDELIGWIRQAFDLAG